MSELDSTKAFNVKGRMEKAAQGARAWAERHRKEAQGPAEHAVGNLQPMVQKEVRFKRKRQPINYWELNVSVETAREASLQAVAEAYARMVGREALERDRVSNRGAYEAVKGGLVVCGCDGARVDNPGEMLRVAGHVPPEELRRLEASARRVGSGVAYVGFDEKEANTMTVEATNEAEGRHHLTLTCRYGETECAYRITGFARVGRGQSGDWKGDIVIQANEISRLKKGGSHGSFDVSERGIWYYTDEGSTNGSTVNGREVPAGMSRCLHVGDRLVLGEVAELFVTEAE